VWRGAVGRRPAREVRGILELSGAFDALTRPGILPGVSRDGVAHHERIALCDLFERLGPDAPTLCEGWATRDLAAHLVVRESQPLALPGDFLEPLHGITARFEQRTLESNDFVDLVERLRTGPPSLPLGLPVQREFFNVHEFFVHHEDVRRANGLRPRRLGPALDAALWWRLRAFGPYLVRNLRGLGVQVSTPDGRTATLLPGRPQLQLSGATGELFMYVFNRRRSARVRVDGPLDAIERLEGTRLGV